MVGVPMREEDMRDSTSLVSEGVLERRGPDGETLSRVEEEADGAGADEVGVCALEGVL